MIHLDSSDMLNKIVIFIVICFIVSRLVDSILSLVNPLGYIRKQIVKNENRTHLYYKWADMFKAGTGKHLHVASIIVMIGELAMIYVLCKILNIV